MNLGFMRPPINFRLEFAQASDSGLVRLHNEDCIAISPECGLALLADGMGGYSAGEVAASMVTRTLQENMRAELMQSPNWLDEASDEAIAQWLESHINRANFEVFEASLTHEQYAGMGTTLVMAFFRAYGVTVAHIGDSRCYLFRSGELRQLTRDHSLLQVQIDAGLISPEEAQESSNRNLVTRAVGVDPSVQADIVHLDTKVGDIYLLCSDGLTDMLSDEEIAQVLSNAELTLEDKAGHFIVWANQMGGRDNISVVLVSVVDSLSQDEPQILL